MHNFFLYYFSFLRPDIFFYYIILPSFHLCIYLYIYSTYYTVLRENSILSIFIYLQDLLHSLCYNKKIKIKEATTATTKWEQEKIFVLS